jgi:hypothetical protein
LKYSRTARQEQAVKEHTVDGEAVAIISCTVYPKIEIRNDRITSDYWQFSKETNSNKRTKPIEAINLTEMIPSPWSFRNIAGAVGAVGGVGLLAGACNYLPPSWSTSITNLIHSITSTTTSMPITSIPNVTSTPIPPTHPIPHINPFIEVNGKLLRDPYSPFKPTNYMDNHHYNVKNIAINHHQHSTSLIGKSNIGHLGGAGATKTAHLSFVNITASKMGIATATKAGLLACTFTPLLAIAGIATAGYLGYKAYDYYYGKSDKINEEIANENPNTNDIKTASCKTLKEIKSIRQC